MKIKYGILLAIAAIIWGIAWQYVGDTFIFPEIGYQKTLSSYLIRSVTWAGIAAIAVFLFYVILGKKCAPKKK